MTMGSRLSKRSVERVFPLRNEKYIHSNLKDLVSGKLEQRRQESRSRDRSHDRSLRNPTDNGAIKSASRDRPGYFQQVDDPGEHSYLSRLGENNREAQAILKSALPDRNYNQDTIAQMASQSPQRMATSPMQHKSFDGRSHFHSHLAKAEPRNIVSYRDRELTPDGGRATSEKGAAVAVGPKEAQAESLPGYNRESIEENQRIYEEEEKREAVRQLRQKYNQMMRESLERKAQMEYKRRY